MAAKGIVGGQSIRPVAGVARAECEERVETATAELQRAADSKGVRYQRGLAKDLGDALGELTQNLCQDVEAVGTTALHIIPTARAGVGMFQSAVQDAVRGRLYKGRTDLEHYAESLHTRDRERARAARLKLWPAITVAVISAVAGAALALLVQWIVHRTGIA